MTDSDLSVSGTPGGNTHFDAGYQFGAFAYTTDPVLVRVVPAAGAVQGATAFFRTQLQILNGTASTITGKLVFHPQGHSAAAEMIISSFDANGGSLPNFQLVDYPPNYFVQSSAGDFANNALSPGGWIWVIPTRGKAFVYSSVIDNRTSDSSYRPAEIW